MPPRRFNVVLTLRGYATPEEVEDRVTACLRTHPTLSLLVDAVEVLVEPDGIEPSTPAPVVRLTPALVRRMEAAGFVWGSENPLGWLVRQAERVPRGTPEEA